MGGMNGQPENRMMPMRLPQRALLIHTHPNRANKKQPENGQTKGSLKTGKRRFQAAFNDGHYAKSAYSAVER
ncbi:hypothetical protein [Kingella oralis]|uniref:hypothetical protein n=1 Tax=Kingella oralis TaxID=505 RepID=UPI0034E3A358